MNSISLFFFVFAVIWFVGGLLAFAWLYDQRIKRFLRNSWKAIKTSIPKIILFIAMMGPFLIPIIVSAICLYFG